MAIDMKTVKAITHNNKNLKKIEDSNGDIIWGSWDAFPYRRLEYIHFNGTDNYINSGVGSKQGYYRMFQFDLERNNVRQSTFCCYDGTTSSTNFRRYYVFDIQATDNASGTRACCGNTWSSSFATSNIPLNTKLQAAAVNDTYNSKPRMIFNLKNVPTNTFIIATTTLTGGSNGNLTTVSPYIMACHTVNTGSDIMENPAKGKIYYYEERQTNYQGNIIHQLIPCQRKSDGRCGLYDVKTGTFRQIEGTNESDSAGPVIDEYWDLTYTA